VAEDPKETRGKLI